MKAYTDLEQSRMLVEILPFESADMQWIIDEFGEPFPFPVNDKVNENEEPCWSLTALLSVIPQEIFDGEYVINITEGCDDRWILTYDHHENRNHSYYGLSHGADNLIDACYEMILKLNEMKIL